MRTRQHSVSAGVGLVLALLAGVPGCGRQPAIPPGDAQVIYDLAQRAQHAYLERHWQTLDLAERESRPFLVSGWGRKENAGVVEMWTTSRVARVRVFLPEPRDLTLVVECYPYTRKRIGQALTVNVNGHRLEKLRLPRELVQKEYRVRIPVESLHHGENVLEFRARYVSHRHRKAICVRRITLEGLEPPPSPAPLQAVAGGWRHEPGTRACWRIVVPRAGRLLAQPVFDSAGDGNRCAVHLRLPTRRVQLASHTGSPARPGAVDLSSFGGRRGVLEFENFGTSPVTWKGCVVEGHVVPDDVNVVLLTIDTLRADHVGAQGYARATTPCLDDVAGRGTMFMNAFAVSQATTPSHASMLTGRYPQSHGLIANGWEMQRQQITLAQILSEEGYRTAAYVNFPPLRLRETTGKGFDQRRYIEGTPHSADVRRLGRNVYGQALYWIDSAWQEKFFLWVHSQYLHMVTLPDAYARMFWEDQRDQDAFPLLPPKARRQLRVRYNAEQLDLTDTQIQGVVAFYDGGIRFTDDCIAEFLDALGDYGLEPFTAVVITSDHGLSLGERHRISHVVPPHDHVLHVPLIFLLPGAEQAAGARVDGFVETIDIAPTLLSYLGLQPPRRMQGIDLMPMIRGESGRTKEYAFALASGGNLWYTVRADGWRYIRAVTGTESLARCAQHGGEPVSVLREYPEQAGDLGAVLAQWIRTTPSVSGDGEQEVSDEVKGMLRRAGYLDGSQ